MTQVVRPPRERRRDLVGREGLLARSRPDPVDRAHADRVLPRCRDRMAAAPSTGDEESTTDTRLVVTEVRAKCLDELGVGRHDPGLPLTAVLQPPFLASRALVRPR